MASNHDFVTGQQKGEHAAVRRERRGITSLASRKTELLKMLPNLRTKTETANDVQLFNFKKLMAEHDYFVGVNSPKGIQAALLRWIHDTTNDLPAIGKADEVKSLIDTAKTFSNSLATESSVRREIKFGAFKDVEPVWGPVESP